jgi:hypothetical protein
MKATIAAAVLLVFSMGLCIAHGPVSSPDDLILSETHTSLADQLKLVQAASIPVPNL